MGEPRRVGTPGPAGWTVSIVQNVTPVLEHLHALTGDHGLFEHALHDEARQSHGYTTDDNARALVVLARLREAGLGDPDMQPYLGFVTAGVVAGGWHNRMSVSGDWDDLRGSDDAHGRAIWGLAEAVTSGEAAEEPIEAIRAGLLSFQSLHLRAISYAVFGAVKLLEVGIFDDLAGEVLERLARRLPVPRSSPWMWPEPRLTYANARAPEAMIRAGHALGEYHLIESGLELLEWLVDRESSDRWFSFTPVAGRGPDDGKPGFDQQPIEAWAMADACFAAYQVTSAERWRRDALKACQWFLGLNDSEIVMYDSQVGAGFDGLSADAANQNRGAESTLAALGAMIRLHQLTGGHPGS